jgi:hypothetical protein
MQEGPPGQEARMFGFGDQSKARSGWFARRMQAQPIAVDFGRASVRVLQLGPGGTAYRCAAAAEIPGTVFEGNGPRFEPRAMAERLRGAVTGLGFSGNRVSATLPAELFQVDIARMPSMNDRELADSVRFEALDRFGLEASEAVVGFLRLGATVGGGHEVLMMALPRAVVASASEALTTPVTGAVRLEHAGLAALRAITRQRGSECADPADARDYAMIHLEDRVATLVVLREGNICFLRSIKGEWAPAGMTMSRRTRATRTNGDDIEIFADDASGGTAWRWCSLAEESLRCLRHVERASGGWWPREVAITGPAATDPEAAATVESVCGVSASLAVPIRMVSEPEACVHGNAWIAALGAACAELPGLARNPRPPAPAPAAAAPSRIRDGRRTMHAQPGRAAAASGTAAIELVPEPEPKPVLELTKGGA